ncbi:MAG: MBL fold metallo-hydrolase [Oscillospiraceae bacterium]|nr:MBL fold metallo-hydrolase [Oscillospiraceae bacterium]
MKLTFLGATHEVTGSCTLIEINGKYGIVDCGMEQGQDIFENQEIPVQAGNIDFVLLTHAHIDHSGNLPLLYKNGYSGLIYATAATTHLCEIMLRDCAHIQESEAEWKSRKSQRAGGPAVEPVYTMADAEDAIAHLRPVDYGKEVHIGEGVVVRFTDAGHLMGSSSIEVWLTEGGVTKKIVFSGDIGNLNQPLLKDPVYVEEADYVVTESTYGNRYHEKGDVNNIEYLADCIQRTFDRGGNVVIPSFAVGRTQEMLYFIREIKVQGLVSGHGDFPVYVDSPLANEATGIFLQADNHYFDDETRALIDQGINPLMSPGVQLSVTSEESKAINLNRQPKVIISASGMCEAGRIRHHLKHNLWRRECLILFVGYQAAGTTGRAIRDGAKKIKLFGEEIKVNAEISYLPGKSGHADKDGLIKWIQAFKEKPHTVFVNHGDPDAVDDYAACLKEEYGYNTLAPYSGTSFDLLSGEVIELTDGVPIAKKAPKDARAVSAFDNLLTAAYGLIDVIKACKGIPNKELGKFAGEIRSLASKWEGWANRK